MPDITMCASVGCPLERTCYRHAASGAQSNPIYQSYALFKMDGDGRCANYWGPVWHTTTNTGSGNDQ